jgi:phosphoglycolate phosphatase
MSKPLRLVIFDLDGTLIDSYANIARAVREAGALLGLPEPHPDDVPKVIGLELSQALARLFPAADPETHKRLDHEYRECFVRYRTMPDYKEPLFAGTYEVLDELERAGYLLGIATGKAMRGVNYLLKTQRWHGRFVTIQTPDHAPGKPHPGMILQAIAETGVERENTVMVGDTTFDIEMARAAGVGAIGVSWGNHSVAELQTAGAHRVIDRLSDLLQVIETLAVPAPIMEKLP